MKFCLDKDEPCSKKAMLEKLTPETVICFGDPLPEMRGNIISVDYRSSRKVVR